MKIILIRKYLNIFLLVASTITKIKYKNFDFDFLYHKKQEIFEFIIK